MRPIAVASHHSVAHFRTAEKIFPVQRIPWELRGRFSHASLGAAVMRRRAVLSPFTVLRHAARGFLSSLVEVVRLAGAPRSPARWNLRWVPYLIESLITRHGHESFFYSIHLGLIKFWFDSTHHSQWLYKNWFKSAYDSKWICEIWFNRLTTQKLTENFDSYQPTTQKIQNFDLNRFMTQKTWNIDSNQVMTQWFESTVDIVDRFLAFTQFRWLFLGFLSILLTFLCFH